MSAEQVKRLEIWMADYSLVKGSEQGGAARPVIVVSNEICNKFSPVITVAPITSKLTKKRLPTHITLSSEKYGLTVDSFIMTEQLRSIDKSRLMFKITEIDENDSIVEEIDTAMMIQLGLVEMPKPKARPSFISPVVKRQALAFA